MLALGRHGWWITAVAACALAVALRSAGMFRTVEHAVDDARARLLAHSVASDIVIVGLDAQSLAELDHWPWPRRHHASLIRRLAEARPASVFLDIDFSSQSNALDDAAFEGALAQWPGSPVVLPVFFQPVSATDPAPSLTRPLARFERHARLAAVNRLPGADGLERSWRTSWSSGGQRHRTVIDPDGRLESDAEIPIDFSISPRSFNYVSYIDVLKGRVPATLLAGKRVFVGATAVELGDMVPVPVYRSLAGVVVQALAVESVRAGPLRPASPATIYAALAAWTLLFAAALRRESWRRNAAILVGAFAALLSAALLAHARLRWQVEVVPFVFAAAAVFLGLVLRSLDEQTWRALSYALGLRRRDALLKSIVESSTDSIVCIDAAGVIQTANPAAQALFGCAANDLVGAPIASFVPGLAVAGGDETHVLGLLDGRISEWDALAGGGQRVPIELSVSRVKASDEHLYTAIARNISERKVQQRRLEHQATHDDLTQLPNRGALITRLERALAGSAPAQSMSLLMLDLCRFKEINDTLGHPVGDEVLGEVGRRLRQAVGDAGYVARIGGDEFTVLVEHAASREDLAALSQALAKAVATPVAVAGVSIEVGLSIGVARCPEDAADAVTLLKRADVAMFVAKRQGSVYEFYDAAQDGHSLRRLSMGGDLRAAIAGDTLALHYQPKVHLRNGRVDGVEALMRWTHPVHGPVSPAEFIAFAESTELIRPLTEWALRRALRDRASWQSVGLDIRVAVNLSARLLQDAGFPARLAALLDEAGAGSEALELEITESAMMADPSRALRTIGDIHRLGVAMSVDDYGSGYSSLAYLRDLPIHALKLDKSFVTGVRSRNGDRVIVESTAQMAHALGLLVVAEGVEDGWEAQFLQAAGYDYCQGYFYSAALPAAELAAWIAGFQPRKSGRVSRVA